MLESNMNPPFRVTRSSHVILNVRDPHASREFYEQVIGLVLTEGDDDVLYYRGVEEACHHSLVLRRSDGPPTCPRIGLRVYTEDDLDQAHDHFAAVGGDPVWVDASPQRGRTLHVTDPGGVPLELCATMPVQPRQITAFHLHRGGCAQRLDHFQLVSPNVPHALDFYLGLGFRLSEYIGLKDAPPTGVFLQRKGNPHDIVFVNGPGPRLHHTAFFAQEAQHLMKACDVAGTLGYGPGVERGPGRHGPGYASFVYFRDPDGHRIELFNTHYQIMDIENVPVRWDPHDPNLSYPWGLPAQRRWFEEATPFDGVAVTQPATPSAPMTLERYLAERS